MDPEMVELLRSVNATQEQFATIINRLNDAPNSTPIPEEVRKAALAAPGSGIAPSPVEMAVQRQIMAQDQISDLKEALKTKSLRELHVAFAKQAARQDTGIPLHQWLSSGGAPLSARWGGSGTIKGINSELAPDVSKALDTAGGSALVRQDLEPFLWAIFVKTFPLADQIRTEPANGLLHAYDQQTSFGDADWIGELDTVTDDRGTYVRKSTNIGILATRRGVTLKQQFAVLAGGAGFDPERLELQAGMWAMSSRLQKTLLRGNALDDTGTLTNERGAFDVDSFDGLRYLTSDVATGLTANVNVDPATNPDTTGSMRRAFDAAILPMVDSGAVGSIALWGSPTDQITFDEQQDPKLRVIQDARTEEVTVGVRAVRVNTIAGVLPFYGVPGGYVGAYNPGSAYAGASSVRDIYGLTLDTLSRPYLGSDGITVLEIPVGVGGQLTHLFIMFMMTGFADHVPNWNNKVRVKAA